MGENFLIFLFWKNDQDKKLKITSPVLDSQCLKSDCQWLSDPKKWEKETQETLFLITSQGNAEGSWARANYKYSLLYLTISDVAVYK